MGQIEMMYSNIDGIVEATNEINMTVNIGQPTFDIKEHFMTNRQIMKKVIMAGGDMSGIPNPEAANIQMSEESAHSLVYGKLMYDDNGNLVDDEVRFPECVDKKSKVKKSHPMKMWIKNKKLEVGIAFDQLKSKSKEIAEATKQLTIETTASFITIGSSAVILPTGSGLPTAFSALQGIFASLQAFQTKINQILPILEPLTFIVILIAEDMVNEIVKMINTFLGTIKTALSAVAEVISLVNAVKDLLPSGPDGELLTDELELEVSANKSMIVPTEWVKLKATASNGSWQYTYLWEDENGNVISHKAEKVLQPDTTSEYTCTVTDKSTGAFKTGQVTVEVLY